MRVRMGAGCWFTFLLFSGGWAVCASAEPPKEDDDWGKEVEGYRLGVRCRATKVTAGEPADVTIILRNVGAEATGTTLKSFADFEFTVKMDMLKAPVTAYYRKIEGFAAMYGKSSFYELQPGGAPCLGRTP